MSGLLRVHMPVRAPEEFRGCFDANVISPARSRSLVLIVVWAGLRIARQLKDCPALAARNGRPLGADTPPSKALGR